MRYVIAFLGCLVLGFCARSPQDGNDRQPSREVQEHPTPAPLMGEKKMVRVFYAEPGLEHLIAVDRQIFDTEDQTNQVKQTIDLLTIPPEDVEQAQAVWPPSTFAREVYLLDTGTVLVDLDSSFLPDADGGVERETCMIDSMIQTILENFPTFSHVQLLLDGHVQETLLGHIDIESPLTLPPKPETPGEVPPEDEIEVEDLLSQQEPTE